MTPVQIGAVFNRLKVERPQLAKWFDQQKKNLRRAQRCWGGPARQADLTPKEMVQVQKCAAEAKDTLESYKLALTLNEIDFNPQGLTSDPRTERLAFVAMCEKHQAAEQAMSTE